MLKNIINPTLSQSEVSEILTLFHNQARAVLGDRLVALYLTGSLAIGDFDPATSDIDFVAVTAVHLASEEIAGLERMHAAIAQSGLKFADKLEGSYITREALRRYDPQDGPFPCVIEEYFYLARHESYWVLTRHILRECGVVLYGPSPRELIDPVSAEDIRQAILGYLHEWWKPMLQNPVKLKNTEYQAYAVLSMCRAIYTLSTGKLASKSESAKWALDHLEAKWSQLLHWALEWNILPPADHQSDTEALISDVVIMYGIE